MAYNLFQRQQPQQKQPQAQPAAVQTQPTEQQYSQWESQTKPMAIDPNSPTSGMDAISSMLTTPEQEEKMRKASVANQRILAVADAIRHIGNIAHTVNYAPSQQFNSPVQEEQARYEKGKAVRDAANLKYYTYQQAKAAQDQKQRQWETTFNYNMMKDAANAAALQQYRDRTIKERGRIADQNLAYRKENDEANRNQRQGQYDKQNAFRSQSLAIQRQNANNQQAYRNWRMNGGGSGGGSGVAPLDTPNGRITPNGRNYSNQLLQMFDYAKSKGYVQESDVAKRLREMGFGKDQSDNVKRQMVMDLLRSNQDMGDYAANRLGWTYGAGGGAPSIGWDDEEDDEENNDGLSIGW